MQLVPGGVYRLGLDLSAPTALHPAWLAGAVGVSYPGAEVVGVRPTETGKADVTIRWSRKSPGTADAGDSVVPLSEGLQMLPGANLPMASVTSVEPLHVPMVTRSLSLQEQGPDILKLAASLAMIGTVAFVIYRVKQKKGSRA